MCALSLYANDIACKFFMKKQKASIWLFYNKNETTTILNSKQITQNYSFMKESNVCIYIFITISIILLNKSNIVYSVNIIFFLG